MTMTWEECAAAGMTARQAAEHRGTSYVSAYLYAARHGFRFARADRSAIQKAAQKAANHTIKADPARIRELAAEGLSQAVIADALGVSRERIRQICARDGIETLPGWIDYDLIDQIEALAAQGLSRVEIARATGRDSATVCGIVKREGIAIAHKGHRPGRSGYRGVCLHKPTGLWRAYFRDGQRRVSLGYHATPEAAHAARCEYIAKLEAAQ